MEKEFLVYFHLENLHFSFTTQMWRQEKTKKEGLIWGIGVELRCKKNREVVGHSDRKQRSESNCGDLLRSDRLFM